MKAIEFADVLSAHAASVNAAGGAEVGRQLLDLADVCTSAGAVSIAAFAKKIQKQLSGPAVSGPGADALPAPVDQLAALATTLNAAKAKSASGDAIVMSELAAAIMARGDGPVAATLRELAAAKPTRSPASAKPKVDKTVAHAWADRLERANSDPDEFKIVLAELKAERSVTKLMLELITGIFVGVELCYKSKAAAFKKIEERHFVDSLNDSRARIIDRVAI